MVGQFVTSSKGVGDIQRDIHLPWLRNVRVPLPEPGEQAAIATFLNYADRRIWRYIRAKQKLARLLEERRRAQVDRAVLSGLTVDLLSARATTGLSESSLPADWRIIRARFLFRAVNRRDVRDDDIKFSVTQRSGLIATDDMQESSTQAASFERFQVCHPGDLVLNKYKAHLGVFWAAEQRGLITPNYSVFRTVGPMVSEYAELLFHTRTYRNAFSMMVYGVTEGMSPLYTNDFYDLPTVCPPLDEQRAIVQRVADITSADRATLGRLEREVELIREYRAVLIADVVTGKLDVREAAAKLPDEIEEPDELQVVDETLEGGSEAELIDELAEEEVVA